MKSGNQRDDSAGSPKAAADEKSLGERESVVQAGEQAVLGRRADVGLREDAVDLREDAASQREAAASQREGAASQREGAATLREITADSLEKALRNQKAAAQARLALSAGTEEQLREANERLVIASLRAHTMTEAAEKTAVQMAHMAEHDFLTGLPNRALLTDRLAQSIALAQRHGEKVALLFLDLDHFKNVNDSLGHAVGDQLLQSVAKRLQSCLRLTDTVSRQGGDEFVVLLAEVKATEDVGLTAGKLIDAMTRPHHVNGHQLHVSLSIGISLYPDDGQDVDAMFRNADTAMYHAKKSGRNNYQVFTQDMNARAVARQSIEQALHSALERRELVLHYQPKVNLETGALAGAEALLRWRRPDMPLVPPAQFVGVAEDSGLILPIGKWVLREACGQFQAWLKDGFDVGHIAVNVSAVEFHGSGFLADVGVILKDTGLDPHRLELELTESGLMQDTQQTMAILHALKELGVRIAIDDFGTGYSSLSYLRSFTIDALKIDQSFVQTIDGGAGEAIVSAVIAMGSSLRLRVVAEGIETRSQLVFLRSRGCAEGQGFLFGRPMAAEQLFTRCRSQRCTLPSDEK